MSILIVKVGKKKIRIKNCNGLASVRGLMFDDLKNYKGALIYANNIWMPFVKHELDLLFLDKNLKILNIQRAVPVTLNVNTWKTYRCSNACYCLEIKAGLTKIKKGTRVLFLSG